MVLLGLRLKAGTIQTLSNTSIPGSTGTGPWISVTYINIQTHMWIFDDLRCLNVHR